jgi:hypothetical protein
MPKLVLIVVQLKIVDSCDIGYIIKNYVKPLMQSLNK